MLFSARLYKHNWYVSNAKVNVWQLKSHDFLGDRAEPEVECFVLRLEQLAKQCIVKENDWQNNKTKPNDKIIIFLLFLIIKFKRMACTGFQCLVSVQSHRGGYAKGNCNSFWDLAQSFSVQKPYRPLDYSETSTNMRVQAGPIRFSLLNSPSNYFGRRFGRRRIKFFKKNLLKKSTSAETPKSRRNPSNSTCIT